MFTHLHVHSHYSLLDGMSKVPDLIDKCLNSGMRALALTDHGNMFGVKELFDITSKMNDAPNKKVKEAKEKLEKCTNEEEKEAIKAEIETLKAKAEAYKPFIPIIGVEAYCARRTLYDKDNTIVAIDPETGKESKLDRNGWHLILLAKNKTGYLNLCRIVSVSWIDGFYGKPRIDKNLLKEHSEGIICCSACLGGELPQHIIAGDIEKAEQTIEWFKDVFGDDYYIELQRHETDKPNAETSFYERQKQVNPVLIDLAHKHGVKLVATNDVHFVEESHAEAHDRLICLSTGKDYDDPSRMRYSKQEWLKTPEEMAAIFSDVPEALENTQEIVDKVELYSINSDPIMPKFPIPEEFGTEEDIKKKYTAEELYNEFTCDENGNVVMAKADADKKIAKMGGIEKLYRIKLEAEYLNKITWEGAEKRYGSDINEETRQRIKFELHVMKSMGFPGYFLIVQDYIRAAREELDVWVGPGRGSAAGSVVAYCLWITNVDPMKYDLLFERFLNPDRISLPDIDVDFEDSGRGKVLDWVTQRYGFDHVAHIITYGTMATKMSIKDLCRVQKVELSKSLELCKLVPEKEFDDTVPKDKKGKKPKINLKNCFEYIPGLKEARFGDDKHLSQTLELAGQLEGTIRGTGIHACGVIIGADDLAKFAPMATVKDKSLGKDTVVTQYDGHVIESVGLIKMDFLGLSTLTLQKETIKNIKKSRGIDVDIEAIPIDDQLTYQLFSEGRTIGIFQFESPGMQKYLRELKPTVLTDLIAMNALYRPGPIAYIPDFIKRKHGLEPIVYDIPVMEKYLKDTYGVTVYQEQVMLLSRLLANFTRGQSDQLRKAMGKKLINILEELKVKFLEGGQANGHNPEVLEKIWKDWEAFASYAFNKSHSTCYAWVAYQTGYLKAHYPAEYMAANLTLNRDNITEIKKLMTECKSMRIHVKGPNVNESELNFTVNDKGEVLFGLGGVKNVGAGAVEAIVSEREANGPFTGIFNFVERVNLSACNRRTIEALALAGAFDEFEDIRREHFFELTASGEQFSELLSKYGQKFQTDKAMHRNSLFGDLGMDSIISRPDIPVIKEEWSDLNRLNKEREYVGIYLTAHPLDNYEFELTTIANTPFRDLEEDNLAKMDGKTFSVAGIVTSVRTGMTKKNMPYTVVKIENTRGAGEFFVMGRVRDENIAKLCVDNFIYINGKVGYIDYGHGKKSETIRKQILEIGYLEDLKDNCPFTTMNITMRVDKIDSVLIQDLHSLLVPMQEIKEDERMLRVMVCLYDVVNDRRVELEVRGFKAPTDQRLTAFITNLGLNEKPEENETAQEEEFGDNGETDGEIGEVETGGDTDSDSDDDANSDNSSTENLNSVDTSRRGQIFISYS